MLIFYIILCVLSIGFFAGSEVAFIAANKLNIELKNKQGKYVGKVFGRFTQSPYELSATTTTGFTFSLVMYSLLINRLIEEPLSAFLKPFHINNSYIDISIHFLLSTLLATMLILVLAEMLPKAIFKNKADIVLKLLAFPISLAHYLLFPITQLLVSISEFILKYLFNVRIKEDKDAFLQIDLDQFTRKSLHGAGTNHLEVNRQLFENALSATNIQVRSCMVPRNEIVAVEKNESIENIQNLFHQTQLSKIIVYEKNIDHIIGYLHHLDLINKPYALSDILHSIPPIPETITVVSTLELLNKERKSIGLVVDEFGGTAGIITREDLLEQFFGEIQDEFDVDNLVEKRIAENEYLFSGRHALQFLKSKYSLDFGNGFAETLSGYIIRNHEEIPRKNDRIIINNFEFEVLLVSDTRIETVKLTVLRK